jgi:hypothetical protein
VTDANACTGSTAYSLTILAIPAAIANLASQQVRTGNDVDGTTKITVTFTLPPGASSVEVYRAGFGHYPEYDDAGGAVPATPSYPPGGTWTLTGVTASGQTDEPVGRDFYYYVAFAKNAGGGVAAVSNKTGGALNYHLGDVSDGATAGQGNNSVSVEDVSLLGSNYGIGAAEIATRNVKYLDVGPTTNLQITSRPFTDKKIDFEDLIVIATNYQVVSAPQAAATPASAKDAGAVAGGSEEFRLEGPTEVVVGQVITATLRLTGAGRIQGFSAALEWDHTVLEPIGMTSGQFIEGQGGVVLTPALGTVDAALLGARGEGMTGTGTVATLTFRVLRNGSTGLQVGHVIARDAQNNDLGASEIATRLVVPLPAITELMAPWPNPFGESAGLMYAVSADAPVELVLFGVDGRRVRTLVSEFQPAGVYRVAWDGTDDTHSAVGSGVYYAQLNVAGKRFVRKIVRVK